ncbi:interferon-induced protein 44-like [Megalops cyprinoides]|uniref:interferon-induced protein 44-like n=1 Tax=Megalops cyprinoides TaxID=118141 RepID=UPI001864D7B6|nr:interferon-induced protein 44-like [Megalops cyprinoides]
MSVVKSNLSIAQEKRLCSLFGHVKLSLLFKASIHGYKAVAFHSRCDRQGPTVVVAYNNAGFIFGAYTCKDYLQTGQNIADDKAFLFSFRAGDQNQCPRRIPAINSQQAFGDTNTGPNFGALVFLHGNAARVDSAPGTFYNFVENEMHGNDLKLTECEVYRVEDLGGLLEKPWRNVNWTSEKRKELMEGIQTYKPTINSVKQARILLIGPVGAGKSSFFNSINSIFRGHVTSQAISGSAGTSLTTQFRTYSIKSSRDGKPLPIVLCDTMGLEETTGAGLDLDDITSILKGHVMDRYQFNPIVPLQAGSPGYRKCAGLEDRIHCVAYMIDACKVTLISQKLEEKLGSIRRRINLMGIPQLLLVTKVDEACRHVHDDLKEIYRSHYIERKVQEVAARLGIPVSCVIPVKNYSQEMDLDPHTDILLLSAVMKMLHFADNYFDDICMGKDEKHE